MDDRLSVKYLLVIPVLFSSYFLHAQVQCNYFSAGLTVSNAPLTISYSDNSEEAAFELSKLGFVIEAEGDRELENNRKFSTSGGIKLFTGGARHSTENSFRDSISQLLLSSSYNTFELSVSSNLSYTLDFSKSIKLRLSVGLGANVILNTIGYEKEESEVNEENLIKTAFNFDGLIPANLEYNTGFTIYKQVTDRRYFVKYSFIGDVFPTINNVEIPGLTSVTNLHSRGTMHSIAFGIGIWKEVKDNVNYK